MTRRSLEVHDHSKSGSGGAQLNPTKLGIPEFATDSEAPNETLYFESTAEQVRYKDENGTVHAGAGLENGENFDGQGTSEFTNLAAVETNQLGTNIEDGTDVSGSRAKSTEYQNDDAYVRQLSIKITNNTGASASINAYLYVFNSSGVASDSDIVDRKTATIEDGSILTLKGLVPPGGYYLLTLAGSGTISAWDERGWV